MVGKQYMLLRGNHIFAYAIREYDARCVATTEMALPAKRPFFLIKFTFQMVHSQRGIAFVSPANTAYQLQSLPVIVTTDTYMYCDQIDKCDRSFVNHRRCVK